MHGAAGLVMHWIQAAVGHPPGFFVPAGADAAEGDAGEVAGGALLRGYSSVH